MGMPTPWNQRIQPLTADAAELLRDQVGIWREHIKNWQKSGLSVRAYCIEKGLSDTTFCIWRRRLGGGPLRLPARPKRDENTAEPGLEIVSLGSPRELPLLSRIVLSVGPYRIEVPDGFQPETLSAVLRTVEGL